ncbi:hypothetical protein [Terrisporobacter muris]|uniref:Uncharacterized protein n=1 Tax=Terrisporobacter muris TaxID=2963284 RepID=A0A9X2MAH0_9FIRM|nr:hypothetical protein [Terrisporobacter muris]MCR1823837.1 hypothetical protein [Terrisporobacter muris]
MKENINKVLEIKNNDKEFEYNCYRVLYKDDKFNISFGNFDEDNNRVIVDTDINFSNESFKKFFDSILLSILDYQEKTGENFFEVDEGEDLNE